MSDNEEPNVDKGTNLNPEESAALKALLDISAAQKAQIDQTKQAKQQEAQLKLGQTYAQLAQAAKQNPQAVMEHFNIDPSKFQQTSQPSPSADPKLNGKLEELSRRLDAREKAEAEAARQAKLNEVYELVDAHIESNLDKYQALSKVGPDYRMATFNKFHADVNSGKKTSEAEAASYVDSQLFELAETLYDLVTERRKAAQKSESKPKEEPKVDLSSSTVGEDVNLSHNQKLAKLIEAATRSIKQ